MKWNAALGVFILVSGAASSEVPTGPDDTLAMLQGSLRVAQNSNTTSVMNESEEVQIQGSPDSKSVTQLEDMVLNRLKDGSLKGNFKLAAVINASIKNMYTAILSATKSNQKTMKLSIAAFKRCKTKMWKNYGAAIPLEKKHWILKHIYPKCIRAERKLRLMNSKVWKTYKLARDMYKNLKRLMRIKGRSCGNRCTNLRNENYHEQLQRLVLFYSRCRKRLGPLQKRIKRAKKMFHTEHKKYYITSAKYRAMLKKCKKIAYLMNTRKCASVTKLATGCKGYGRCWKIALRNYRRNKRQIQVSERDMKVQWRALKRIQCYLQVIDDKPVKVKGRTLTNKQVIDGCIKMKRPSTRHLNINYGRVPRKPRCPKDKSCPCSLFYVANAYRTGPKSRCAKNLVRRYRCPICRGKRQWRRR